MQTLVRLLTLSVLLPVFPSLQTAAAVGAEPAAVFSVPVGNVAFSAPVLDASHVVYGVARPQWHKPTCVSCGQAPFTNFRMQLFIRNYSIRSRAVHVSAPRLLFQGPVGASITLYSFNTGWLVYESETIGDRWQLFVGNVASGRVILLDSPRMEGEPSRFLHASSDASTVVWQSWTRIRGRTTSVIRSYSLATGKRRLLVSGGTGLDYFYGDPHVSGNRLLFVKEPGSSRSSQLFIENIVTRRIRALTPPSASNDEPSVSGNVAAWMHGRLDVGYSHGLVVENLVTGKRMALRNSSAQLPRVVAGRYVLFATDYPAVTVQLYDALTGRRWTVAGPRPDAAGFVPSGFVRAGGTTAAYEESKMCSAQGGACPWRLAMLPL